MKVVIIMFFFVINGQTLGFQSNSKFRTMLHTILNKIKGKYLKSAFLLMAVLNVFIRLLNPLSLKNGQHQISACNNLQ